MAKPPRGKSARGFGKKANTTKKGKKNSGAHQNDWKTAAKNRADAKRAAAQKPASKSAPEQAAKSSAKAEIFVPSAAKPAARTASPRGDAGPQHLMQGPRIPREPRPDKKKQGDGFVSMS
jgi:hypothetical protein